MQGKPNIMACKPDIMVCKHSMVVLCRIEVAEDKDKAVAEAEVWAVAEAGENDNISYFIYSKASVINT
jgi:hypothetical protein